MQLIDGSMISDPKQDETEYERLSLNMQYDSGFVAYLNGQEIARRNVADVAGVALD